MPRSTKTQKSERLNAAYALLAQEFEMAEAVQRLSKQFALSQRQAYRYVRTARTMSRPVQISEASVPLTLKIPGSLAAALRAHARSSGRSIGEIVTRAIARYLSGSGGHG